MDIEKSDSLSSKGLKNDSIFSKYRRLRMERSDSKWNNGLMQHGFSKLGVTILIGIE